MKRSCNEVLVMPSNYAVMSEEEMLEVSGGGIKKEIAKKIAEFVAGWLAEKGLDYVWNNRKKLWNKFLNGLKPNEYTKASPYYQIFSNSIRH